jgi:glutamate N-acetyltransferase/amino-acid N-acetyltransferase
MWAVAACRYAEVAYDPKELNIMLGDIVLMEKGQPLPFDAKAASDYLKSTCAEHGTVYITLSVGSGPGSGVAWGCDLSYDYVKINAEYTT